MSTEQLPDLDCINNLPGFVCLVGDMNIHFDNPLQSLTRQTLTTLSLYYLVQVINRPTHNCVWVRPDDDIHRKSTVTCSLEADHYCIKSYLNDSVSLLDHSTAFDTTDHPILVLHLHTDFGSTDTVIQWCSSYLTDRANCVSLSNHCSALAPVHSGVLLGSVLGPTLFTIYVNPLSAIIESHFIIHHSFADDLQLQMSAPLIKYLSYFTLFSHSQVMSKLGKLRTCLNLMTTRQNSCL